MTNPNCPQSKYAIDSLILDGIAQMPSAGTLPFSLTSIERRKLAGIETNTKFFADFQLLMLERTDFNKEDLIDYLLKSREYQTMPPENKLKFLDTYNKLAENEETLKDWKHRTISMATGIIIQTALNNGLQLIPIHTDLPQLSENIGLDQKKLIVYQLYDIYQLDPSYLV